MSRLSVLGGGCLDDTGDSEHPRYQYDVFCAVAAAAATILPKVHVLLQPLELFISLHHPCDFSGFIGALITIFKPLRLRTCNFEGEIS